MNAKEIQDWLITHIAELLSLPKSSLDIHEPLANYGLSSQDAVSLSGELEDLLQRKLPVTLLYEYPTIEQLSLHLDDNREKSTSHHESKNSTAVSREPIAVVGLSCRFPGADNRESFWKLLSDGVDAISEVPADRWNSREYFDSDPSVPGKSISYWGGFLERVDHFDPFFFGISPVEAEHMDPQQRLLMELSYEALEDAGLAKDDVKGTKTGVFVGISVNEYSQLQLENPLSITSHSGTGSALSIAANRISYFYDLSGPSIAVDTACSSSLAAVHLACKSILNGESEMAIAGGVNLILSPAHSIAFTKAGLLAPDGRCKTFDSRANGYVRGEGGGLVILKPLSRAIRDNDSIYAVIHGSAMNQDGRSNGLMAPSPEAQEHLLRDAYSSAGISPGTVSYVEAHGTGTLLGDEIEARSLGKVIGAQRKDGSCKIGSVKTNIGHLEAAAGIAGLIKVILSVKNEMIPPSIHYQSPNPHIPFNDFHLEVATDFSAWTNTHQRIAGVNSFGFGGTNVHVVVGSWESTDSQLSDTGNIPRKEYLLPLSAGSLESLRELAADYVSFLDKVSNKSISDVCYSASARRSHLDYRLITLGESAEQLKTELQSFITGANSQDLLYQDRPVSSIPKLVFVFSGQGGQWLGMGRELLKLYPSFQYEIEKCNSIIAQHFGWSLIDLLTNDEDAVKITDIGFVQPALFSIQVALARLWQSWNVTPDALIGHSMGEVAAAHISGALSLEDAIRVICCRSELLRKSRGKGSMVVTELAPVDAEKLMRRYEGQVSVAALNSPQSTVLSGDTAAINSIAKELQDQDLFAQLVNVDIASHSPHMDQYRERLVNSLMTIKPSSTRIPILSTVSPSQTAGLVLNADYWFDNLRMPVQFSDAIQKTMEDGTPCIYIEIGPHPVLLGSIQQTITSLNSKVSVLPSMHRDMPEQHCLFKSVSQLYLNGVQIDWKRLYAQGGNYIRLPAHRWNRQRYWVSGNSSTRSPWPSPHHASDHPLLGSRVNLAGSEDRFVWQAQYDLRRLRFLVDHQVANQIIFPAAAFIEMGFAAGRDSGIEGSHEITRWSFNNQMALKQEELQIVQTVLQKQLDGALQLSIYSQSQNSTEWIRHATADFVVKSKVETRQIGSAQLETIMQGFDVRYTGDELYQKLSGIGIDYGPRFQGVDVAWVKDVTALGKIKPPELSKYDSEGFLLHPTLLDACLQTISAIGLRLLKNDLYLPVGSGAIRQFDLTSEVVYSLAAYNIKSSNNNVHRFDVLLLDEAGQVVAEVTDFSLQLVKRRLPPDLLKSEIKFYQTRWEQIAKEKIPLNQPHEKRSWTILCDAEGYGEKLANKIEKGGDTCFLLPHADHIREFERKSSDENGSAHEHLLSKIPTDTDEIIYLTNLSIPGVQDSINGHGHLIYDMGVNGIMYLIQSLIKAGGRMPRLWIVTRGSQPVTGNEYIAVEQSPAWGFGKVISFEMPDLRCIRLDLDPDQSDDGSIELLLEQSQYRDNEDQIALRQGLRYVQRIFPHSLAGSTAGFKGFDEESTYLVTGGLGGLGLAVAEWMVKQGARHIALLGRNHPNDYQSKMMSALKQAGANVAFFEADLSDAKQAEAAMLKIKNSMPPLKGVMHAAGVLDDAAIVNLDSKRMRRAMAVKIEGTLNLHRLTEHDSLDFFLLFSSAVSVLGSPGQSNYAAASSFLDSFAHYRRTLGLPAMSINWGPWGEVGLAAAVADQFEQDNRVNDRLIKSIQPAEGLAVLDALLSEAVPQVTVLPFDLTNLLELYPPATGMPFFENVLHSQTWAPKSYARPRLRQDYVAPRNDIEKRIADLWQQTLHIDKVGVCDSFFELGGDSVLAAQILTSVQKSFKIRIDLKEAFKAFTVERLAVMVENALIEKIAAMSESEVEDELSKPQSH